MDDSRCYLPSEWHNEERIRVLFGPAPKTHETVAWNARMVFWSAAIHQWCRQTNRLTFTLNDVLVAFRRGTQQPLCIIEVFGHMHRVGNILPLSDLHLGEQQKESWLKWGQRVFLSEPSHFAWTKLKTTIGGERIEEKYYVNMVVLEEMCEHVLKLVWQSSSATYPTNLPVALPQLYHRISDCLRSADDLHLIVGFLAHQGRAVTSVHNGITYVKFSLPGTTCSPTITPMDIAENDLQCAQNQVEENIACLNVEIAKLHSNAKSALQSNSRVQALSCLRRKKKVEAILGKQMGALENVTSCLHQLQEARINKQVLTAFKTGVDAIRSTMAGSLAADSVASTMDELQEVLEECEDVSSLLASGIKTSDVDGVDLEKELDELISNDSKSSHHEGDLVNRMAGLAFPDVPRSNPLVCESSEFQLPASANTI